MLPAGISHMSADLSRAAEPVPPAGRADSLRWVLGALCTGLGALILVAPHRFSFPLFAIATGLRQAWGITALLGGVALLAAAALRPRRPLLVAVHVFAAGTLLALGAAFASSGIWIGAVAYLLLGAGAALGALPSMDEPGRPRDLFALVLAAVATLNGVVFLFVPGATRAPYFEPARVLLPWLGVLYLAGGLTLAAAQLRRTPGRPLVVGAHLLAALPFIAFGILVSARQQAWTALAVNLVYAAALVFLPWSGETLARLRASPLWMRLAFALAATNSLALIVTIAVATAHQEGLVLAHLARSRALEGAAGQELLLELQRGRDVAMLLLLLLAPLAIAAGVLLARRIAQPLAELAHAVGEMNVERPLPVLEESGIAELNGLAAAFTALHERLAERSAESTRLAAELVERAQTLEELDRRKDEFLAMLGHELRNPVGAIANGAHLLQQLPPDDPRVQRSTALILRQVNHLIRLLEDLLDVSRITRGKVTLRPGDVELGEIVRHAIETTRPLFDRKQQQVVVALPEVPLLLRADGARLEQVVCNLLRNASDYTAQGGRIDVEATSELGDAVVRVRDDGIGIPGDLLPRIFEPFLQGQRAPGQGGLGIGLTLVKSFVELHGGRVQAKSDGPGRGSELEVRLPAAGPAVLITAVTTSS